jgi:hypothetical protein
LVVVGVVGSEPIDRNRLKPLTPVATDGVVAVEKENSQNDMHVQYVNKTFLCTINPQMYMCIT